MSFGSWLGDPWQWRRVKSRLFIVLQIAWEKVDESLLFKH
jgi:hypothetical protein